MQTRRALVYTLVVAALSSCAWFTGPEPYRRVWVEADFVPDSAVLGSVFEVRALVKFGACDTNVHLALRTEGDTVVVIGLARNDGGLCHLGLVEDYRTLQLTAQPAPTMTIRFSADLDGATSVHHVAVTPE